MMLSINWPILLAVALCVAAISFTITTTSMFKWLREPVANIHPKLEELIFCPWCLGHWITFVILLTSNTPLIIVTNVVFYNFMVTAFVIIAVAGLVHYVLLRSYEPVAKLMMNRQLEKLDQ